MAKRSDLNGSGSISDEANVFVVATCRGQRRGDGKKGIARSDGINDSFGKGRHAHGGPFRLVSDTTHLAMGNGDPRALHLLRYDP